MSDDKKMDTESSDASSAAETPVVSSASYTPSPSAVPGFPAFPPMDPATMFSQWNQQMMSPGVSPFPFPPPVTTPTTTT